MSNYTKTNVGNEDRTELHETLSLTGAEVSINTLPAGASVPFVHSHKDTLNKLGYKAKINTHTTSCIN